MEVSFIAQKWGILSGLKLAAGKGVRKIAVESDSKRVVQCIRGEDKLEMDDKNLVDACIRELRNFFMVEITHVLCDQNMVANAIAKLAKTNAPDEVRRSAPRDPEYLA